MRWMMIALLASLAALLLAAAGVARHILLQRSRLNSNHVPGEPGSAAFDPIEEADSEIEP